MRHSWLVRLGNAVYLKLRHPAVHVPDPTEKLVDKIREFVEANGGKFLVGLQATDAALVRHLEAARIPFVSFDGAEAYPGASLGGHWTPEGHKVVAERLLGLLSANGVIGAKRRAAIGWLVQFANQAERGRRGLVAYPLLGVYECARWGHVAEWLRSGLQNRLHQFNSGRGLHPYNQWLSRII